MDGDQQSKQDVESPCSAQAHLTRGAFLKRLAKLGLLILAGSLGMSAKQSKPSQSAQGDDKSTPRRRSNIRLTQMTRDDGTVVYLSKTWIEDGNLSEEVLVNLVPKHLAESLQNLALS
jgi:hypothetical protein